MTYMTSTASNAGVVDITVYFKQGTDPDMAAVNVQNRVSKATGQLPAEVTQVGVTTSKRQTSICRCSHYIVRVIRMMRNSCPTISVLT